jgi:hypothetical protein
MTVVDCPVCRSRVNAAAVHCPQCGADPRLTPGLATADLQARGLSVPLPQTKQPWTLRRRLTVATLVALIVIVLLTPLWSGYLGPRVAAYVTTWRPWRTHLTMISSPSPGDGPQRASFEIKYKDPWTDAPRIQDWTLDFVTVERSSSWLPWVVTDSGSGP